MIEQMPKAQGRYRCVLLDKNGKVKFMDTKPLPNGITDAGISALIKYAFNDGAIPTNRFNWVGIGNNNLAFSKTQVDLQGTAYRQAATSWVFTSPDKIQMMAQWGPGQPIAGTFSIYEIGVFNAATGPTMLSRVVRALLSKENLDTLQIYYEFDFNY